MPWARWAVFAAALALMAGLIVPLIPWVNVLLPLPCGSTGGQCRQSPEPIVTVFAVAGISLLGALAAFRVAWRAVRQSTVSPDQLALLGAVFLLWAVLTVWAPLDDVSYSRWQTIVGVDVFE